MDRQAIFDRVATHLLTQMVKSTRDHIPEDPLDTDTYTDNRCMYRGANGTSCAIGCLIPDDKYEARFEGLTPNTDPENYVSKMERKAAAIAFREMLSEVVGATTADDYDFLRSLQQIHDFGEATGWRHNLERFATAQGLKFCVAV